MANATRILRERIVLIFDFDDTLAPSTTEILAKAAKLDHEKISEQVDQMQIHQWQYALAKAEIFRQLGTNGAAVTEQKMIEIGKDYPLFEGASDFIPRLKKYAKQADKNVELEFVMLTAGFATIPKATPLAKQFDRIYAGALHFDDEGYVLGAKRIITHEDKVHYIRQLAQGIDIEKPSELEDTFLYRDPESYYVPLNQIIYCGDGSSDMSAFQVVEDGGGVGIAINKPGQEWEGYAHMEENRRVHNLAKPDFREDSELMQALELSISSMISRIQILRLGRGQ